MGVVDINEVSVVSAALGFFVVLYGLVSLFIKERLYLSESLVSLLVGIIVGPLVLKIFVPQRWSEDITMITKEFTRIVIAIQVMAAGVSLPKAYLYRELKSILVMITFVMGWMWLTAGLFVWLVIPEISFLESLALAACVTPTDPVLANSVVKGKFAETHVPPHVRNILSAESGANDGLGFPFLYLALFLMTKSTGDAIGEWVYQVLLYEILLSCIIGMFIGWLARKVLYLAETKRLIDKESFLAFAIALALFIMGTVSLIGSDDILACFIAGNSLTWDDWLRKETEEAHFQEVIDMLLNLAVFVYVGATMPWSSFTDPDLNLSLWHLVLLSVLLLLFRRLPAILAFYRLIPAIATFREAVFSGWFGPIGVGAIFYSMVAQGEFENGGHKYLQKITVPVVYFCVLSSVLVHGCTIPLFKIGQRINPRILSSTSISIIGNQVARFPVIKFGQEFLFPPKSHQSENGGEPSGSQNESRAAAATTSSAVGAIDSHQEDTLPAQSRQRSSSRSSSGTARISVYDEADNIIIDNETDGQTYVIPRDPTRPADSTIRRRSLRRIFSFGNNSQDNTSQQDSNLQQSDV